MRLTNVLSYSLSSLLLTLAACGDGDSGTPAKFGGATDVQRQRAVVAATGIDAVFGFLIGGFLVETPAESTCPRIAKNGATTTATFGCADDEGNQVDGRVILTNVASAFGGGGPAVDPSKDAVIEFDGYHLHDADPTQEFVFDGRIVLQPNNQMVVTLDAQLNGLAVFTDATFASDGSQTHALAGSSVDLDGVGRATIEGAWNTSSEAPSGAIELHGADLLRADFAATVDGCVPITVDGRSAGQLCSQQSGQ